MDRLFVYGTLRRGGSLEYMLPPHVLETGTKAYLPNYVLYAGNGAYPHMHWNGNEHDEVVGDLYQFNSPDDIWPVVQMELHAGYSMEIVVPYVTLGDHSIGLYSFAFVANTVPAGPLVPWGDWLRYKEGDRE